MRNINKRSTVLIIIAMMSSSCQQFLDVDPPKDKITLAQVFENDEIATSAITGIYSRMAVGGFCSGDMTSLSVLNGLSGDELKSHNATLDGFFQAQIPSASSQINSFWSQAYNYIFATNAVLEGLNLSSSITDMTSKQLQGEAKFIRAFCYFYLVNMFGGVPLNLSSDYRINENLPRTSPSLIYKQIISDLLDAESLLASQYISQERIRPNRSAAKAFLSRVYLFNKEFELAEKKASEVIDERATYILLDDLDKVFLKNSSEAIWQLMPVAGNNTKEGNLFILNATPLYVSLLPELVNSFELNDNRKAKWIKEYTNSTGKYFYANKYKVKTSTTITEYSMVIRLAELYLIRAECRAKLEQADASLNDINVIRSRAGFVVPLEKLSSEQCLLEIEKQRRAELFTEWGHRWLDLKRTGKASQVLAPLKGNSWSENDTLYPIPDNEINRNTNLNQNIGY